ncbi:MAG: GrpB family protein [Planctomycetota bacterium]|nr:GrpB family protein [Planctomycetota bacterium]
MNAVRLMHYDPRWRQEFEQTRSSILSSTEGWVIGVEHIGSTAISGLIARPTIDLVAGVDDVNGLDTAATLIEGLNFRREEGPTWAPEASWLVKPRYLTADQPDPTHRVLLVIHSSPSWQRVIRLRDWLRTKAETAIRFEEAKVARWRNGDGDLEKYRSDKALFFSHLEDQIDSSGS